MAEIENENEVIEEITTQEVIEEAEQEEEEFANITIDDYKALLERNKKAEQTLYEIKKENRLNKDNKKSETITSREDIKKMFLEEKFYEKNPDAENYREKIENYQNINKLSLQDAYDLATKPDKIIEENRKIYWKWVIKWNTQGTEWIALVSMDEYNNMTDDQINKYTSDMKSKYWVVKWK